MPLDWIMGLAGGLLIGGAGALLLLFNGRIMGASGIIGGMIDGTGRGNMIDRAAFVLGVVGMPAALVLSGTIETSTNVTNNLALLVIAGLMVGVGTRMGGGCTSGHGVCGMSRFSVRSIVSTLIYIGAGVAIIIAARTAGVLP